MGLVTDMLNRLEFRSVSCQRRARRDCACNHSITRRRLFERGQLQDCAPYFFCLPGPCSHVGIRKGSRPVGEGAAQLERQPGLLNKRTVVARFANLCGCNTSQRD